MDFKPMLVAINKSDVDAIHYDVMDGHFVSNISFGNFILKSLRANTNKKIDTHLMVSDPFRQYFAYYPNCDTIIFHYEAAYNYEVKKLISDIKSRGKKAGLSINPKTNIEQIYEFIEYCDEVMIMTVEPGVGGQAFIEDMLLKIRKLAIYIQTNNLKTIISVDGGINIDNIKKCYQNGVTKFTVGSFLTNQKDFQFGLDNLRKEILNFNE